MQSKSLDEDFVVRLLRGQVDTLQNVIQSIEDDRKAFFFADTSLHDYVHDNIKSVEQKLRWARKFCSNN